MKPKSPEKSKPEEKDPEKSPTKKQEGSVCLDIHVITLSGEGTHLPMGNTCHKSTLPRFN